MINNVASSSSKLFQSQVRSTQTEEEKKKIAAVEAKYVANKITKNEMDTQIAAIKNAAAKEQTKKTENKPLEKSSETSSKLADLLKKAGNGGASQDDVNSFVDDLKKGPDANHGLIVDQKV